MPAAKGSARTPFGPKYEDCLLILKPSVIEINFQYFLDVGLRSRGVSRSQIDFHFTKGDPRIDSLPIY